MNRLVIIGNGFDLAHGLPTSYKDFIDDYWKNIKDSNHDELVAFKIGSYAEFNGHNNLNDLIDIICPMDVKYKKDGISIYKLADNPKPLVNNRIQIIDYKNYFFKSLNQNAIKNWVDIENIYYNNLKEIAKGEIEGKSLIRGISKLNEEFEQVKNLLERYLNEKAVNQYDLDFIKKKSSVWNSFYSVLKPISLFSDENNILKEFINEEDIKYIKERFEEEGREEVVNNLYILNFNYTPISSIYSELLNRDDKIQSSINFIHGSLGNVSDNKINFGFGDEMDDDYKVIENLGNNEYLKNFKSFQYLQNSNYNDLLRFVDSKRFQVLIMGHSCGLSDRTLLNTIFEHNNCRSIKVFYYETKDDNGVVIKDNYTEIIQNISRHFNKKKLMREKIVNKTLCQPLPQIKLPFK
jgi:hypothetical protein